MKNSVKVALIGDGGVGKTSLVLRQCNGKFEKKYIPTMGTDVHPVTLFGQTYNIWDCAGQEKFGGLRDGYYIRADACICMFDYTSKSTFDSVPEWIKSFLRVSPGKPVIIVGNKSDLPSIKVKNSHITKLLEKMRTLYPHTQFFYSDYSAKSCVGNISKTATFPEVIDGPLGVLNQII